MKPTKEEVEKYRAMAKLEYDLTLTYEEAEKVVAEVDAEGSAWDRK